MDWSFQRSFAFDPLSFNYRIKEIGGDIFQNLGCAAGPLDTDLAHGIGSAQAEVKTQIVLGEVARPTSHFIQLSKIS